ncbi:MAG: hypothetical protein ABIY37_02665 [Devosia sp.]
MRLFFLFLLFVPIVVYLMWDGGDLFRSHDSQGELRRQFHIPVGIEIAKVRRTGREQCWGGGIITGEVQFTDAAYRSYLSELSDRSIWRPTPLHHFNDDIRDYHFGNWTLSWHAVDQVEPGQPHVPFYVNDVNLGAVGPGRLLCYAIQVPTRDLIGTPEETGYSNISVMPCSTAAGSETPRSWVLGFLDESNRTLRMRIQLTNPPQYCTKARRRPFLQEGSKRDSGGS